MYKSNAIRSAHKVISVHNFSNSSLQWKNLPGKVFTEMEILKAKGTSTGHSISLMP